MSSYLRYALFFLLAAVSQEVNAETVSGDKRVNGGQLRYFYDDAKSDACNTVVLVGVGTAMKTDQYNLVSTQMVEGKSVVTIITDHRPNWYDKVSEKRYAKLANTIVADIAEIVPACASTSPKEVIIGGHSASGQAAWKSLKYLDFQPDAFLGLDPFKLSPDDKFELPTLNFGFTKTTCQVTKTESAQAGYQASEKNHRVFYQIDNSAGSAPSHCSFTDTGCFNPVCAACEGSDFVRQSVGNALSVFVQSLRTGVYNRDQYEPSDTNKQVNLYINQDEVVEQKEVTTPSHRKVQPQLASHRLRAATDI